MDVKTGEVLWKKALGHFSYEHQESGILWGRTRQELLSDDPPEDTLYAIDKKTGELLTSVLFEGEQGGVGLLCIYGWLRWPARTISA